MPATLVSIAVSGPRTALSISSQEQLTATATYSDGSTLNVTALCTWSTNTACLSVTSGGTVIAVRAPNPQTNGARPQFTTTSGVKSRPRPLTICRDATSAFCIAIANSSHSAALPRYPCGVHSRFCQPPPPPPPPGFQPPPPPPLYPPIRHESSGSILSNLLN